MSVGGIAGMRQFSRDDLFAGLEALADELERRNIYGHVYLVGGAAMAMTFVPDRMTRDIDAVIERDRSGVMECASAVAARKNWPASWLNDHVAKSVRLVPPKGDKEAKILWSHKHLLVSGASPKYLLAMKIRANRPTDDADIRVLLDVLGIGSREEVFAIHDAVFPEWPLADVEIWSIGRKVEDILARRADKRK